jgi:hypothetical protein
MDGRTPQTQARRVPRVEIENVKENEILTKSTVSMLSAGFSSAPCVGRVLHPMSHKFFDQEFV